MLKKLPIPQNLPILTEPLQAREEGTDWKRAYVALAYTYGTGFHTSEELSQIMGFIQQTAGDEAAKVFLDIVNGTRSNWMQDFMG